jgi:hypothetical protein
MTRSEYQKLVEFLGKKFDAIEDRLRRVEVTQEQHSDLIRMVAEGVANVNERLDRFQEEVAGEFRAVRSEMVAGFEAVRAEFRAVRSEMSAGFEAVRAEFRTLRKGMTPGLEA